MNRKTTPILLAIVLLMGLVTYLSECSRSPRTAAQSRHASAEGATVLSIHTGDILQIRVKRDYWNSYRLARSPDGSWKLVEPSHEAAAEAGVMRLLGTLESLPALSVIDLPSDDAERHREYGLWKPAVEIVITTPDGDQTLLVGAATADGRGVYCTRMGKDRVYVTSPEAVQVLSQELSAYRESKPPSQP